MPEQPPFKAAEAQIQTSSILQPVGIMVQCNRVLMELQGEHRLFQSGNLRKRRMVRSTTTTRGPEKQLGRSRQGCRKKSAEVTLLLIGV